MSKVRKLPFWDSISESFRLTAQNLGFLARVGWKWIALAGVMAAAVPALFELLPDAPGDFSIKGAVQSALESIVRMMCLAAIAVPWHRHLLMSDASAHAAPARLIYIYGAYAAALELATYTGFLAFPYVTEAAVTVPTATASYVYYVIVWSVVAFVLPIVLLYLWGRLSLILPALALGRDASFGGSWRATRGSGWRIFWASFFIFIPFLLLPLTLIGVNWSAIVPGWAETALSTAYFCVAALVGIVFLSIAYRDLVLARETHA